MTNNINQRKLKENGGWTLALGMKTIPGFIWSRYSQNLGKYILLIQNGKDNPMEDGAHKEIWKKKKQKWKRG